MRLHTIQRGSNSGSSPSLLYPLIRARRLVDILLPERIENCLGLLHVRVVLDFEAVREHELVHVFESALLEELPFGHVGPLAGCLGPDAHGVGRNEGRYSL